MIRPTKIHIKQHVYVNSKFKFSKLESQSIEHCHNLGEFH